VTSHHRDPMDRIRGFLRRPRRPDANVARLRRRRHAAAYIHRNLTKLTLVESSLFALSLKLRRTALFIIGYAWMLLIPLSLLSQGTYIDENALQPAQVCGHIGYLPHELM
jgi:glycosylphosphatidylinositol transamidase